MVELAEPVVTPYLAFRGRAEAEADLERIFFEASGRTFEPGAERDAFRERWLGRFLERWPDLAFGLVDPIDRRVVGYLVGCDENPAASPHFADLAYFQDFAALCDRFPAHLHINLDAPYRSRGHGQRLVEAFAAMARGRGAPGMHVVTAAGTRNVGFYARAGFDEVGRTQWNDRTIVMLGRGLA